MSNVWRETESAEPSSETKPTECDRQAWRGAPGSAFPPDAVARIYRPSRSVMTSGKALTRHWILRFERRTPPFIEPLMGWTGGDDTLTQVELRFPSLESAVAYAQRQGLTYVVN